MAQLKKYIFLFFLLPNLLSVSQYTFNFNEAVQYTQLNIKKIACSPYLVDPPEQYYAHIDGHRYPRIMPQFLNKSIDFECLNANAPKKKLILAWTTFFNRPINYTFGIDEYGYCPVKNCEITNDKARLNEADVVLTHMRERGMSHRNLPKTRPAFQRWAFVLYESPVSCPDFSPYNNFYNWTLTYRETSDFPWYYPPTTGMIWQENDSFNESSDILSGKTNEAAAVISNCRDKSGRLKYIEKMREYMSVDIYGKCGMECPIRLENGTAVSNYYCKEYIFSNYKFYLAFENSLCTDYITEKFFLALNKNIIPVVMGQGQYDLYVGVTILNILKIHSFFINILLYRFQSLATLMSGILTLLKL